MALVQLQLRLRRLCYADAEAEKSVQHPDHRKINLPLVLGSG